MKGTQLQIFKYKISLGLLVHWVLHAQPVIEVRIYTY